MALGPLRPTDPANYGPYQLHGRLGSGGMGVVYLAFGPDSMPVALKVLQPTLAEDREYRVRFVREVSAARLVDSPFVARVVDAETDSEPLWMATEYVEGATLAHAVDTNGPVPADRLRGFGADLASAVGALHSVGLVHRDLKPANVVLAWSGPKLIDFGIAKHEGTTDLTQTGVTVGSLLWMSPEVLNGRPALRSSDIFAWGLCVAFAGTGRPPFGAGNPQAVAYRIGNEQPDLHGLPPDLAGLVAAALLKDPFARPVANDLCGALGARAQAATAVAVPRPEGGWTGPNPAAVSTAAAPPPAPPPSPPANWPQPPRSTLPLPPGRPSDYAPSHPPTPPPPDGRRRLLVPLIILGVLVVAAGVAIAILATSGGGSPKPTPPPITSAPPHPPTTTTPPSTSPTTLSPANAAAALDTLLSDSTRSRANVVAAVGSAQSCSDPTGAATTLQQAAAARTDELNRLQALDLLSIDADHSLVTSLTEALTQSRDADNSFAAWANAVVGCSGSAPQDANFAAANQSSMVATAAKQSFINQWNPIAEQFGLTPRQESDI